MCWPARVPLLLPLPQKVDRLTMIDKCVLLSLGTLLWLSVESFIVYRVRHSSHRPHDHQCSRGVTVLALSVTVCSRGVVPR